MKEFIWGNIRVQILSCDIMRIECAENGAFCDGNTYFIPDRSQFFGYDGEIERTDDGAVISVADMRLFLPKSGKTDGITLSRDGAVVWKCKRSRNSGELPPPDKTPNVFALTDSPRITIPDRGYRVGAKFEVEKSARDVYLLVCGGDRKKLRELFVSLTGRPEMVRLSTLGFWNSRYFKYDDKTAREMIDKHIELGIPLDNMVIDTDWRKASDRGIGYEIDDALFPDMKGFFDYAHSRGVEIMFNDHPEPVEGTVSVFDEREIEYRESNLRALLELGLDYWWYDRNWRTKLKSPVAPKIAPESLGMYVFHAVTEQTFKDAAGGGAHRRPIIMANVDNVMNGNYMGINDSATHRYSIQWTGDIGSDFESLGAEISSLIRAQNNCIAYINSDCGGHIGNPTKQEYIRWMQFGALSPVLRPHCTNSVTRFREPWAYDNETLNIVREYIKMRYRLLPVLYKSAYENYSKGSPLLTPIGYEYPDDKKAAKNKDEYFFGKGILVAPLHGPQAQKLKQFNYLSPVKATFFDGIEHKGEPLWNTEYPKLDLFWSDEQPSDAVPMYYFSAIFETDVLFDRDVELIVESDDGVTVYVDGHMTLEDRSFHAAAKMSAGMLKAGTPHHLKIYYFQGGGNASISLYYNPSDSKWGMNERLVYLPQGEYIDVFNGSIHAGGRTAYNKCTLSELPIYVKAGSVIPLLKSAQNTKQLDFGDVTYDFYPSKSEEYSDYLYEDDGATVAYKNGDVRISPFGARYDESRHTVCLTLEKSRGKYDDGARKRHVTIRYHLLGELKNVEKVTVDGNEVQFEKISKYMGAFPFSTDGGAPDGDILVVKFEHELDKDSEILFHIK